MTKNIYIAGAEQGSGKSAIVLAVMEYLSSHSEKTGFFRPIIKNTPSAKVFPDSLTRLIASRYGLTQYYDRLYGCTQDTANEYIKDNRYDDLVKLILGRYQELAKQFDIILCAGTDFKSAGASIEFDFNIDVANNLGCFIIPVVNGKNRTTKQVLAATSSFHKLLQERDADILATIINRVTPELKDEIKQALDAMTISESDSKQNQLHYVLPDVASLSSPTISDISRALETRLVCSSAENLQREVMNFKIAAMTMVDYLNHIEQGSLIITPGDRADIILSTLMSYSSSNYPQVSGMLLTGGIEPGPTVKKLLQGLSDPPFSILSTSMDTFTTAMAIKSINVELDPENERKIAAVLGLAEDNIDLVALGKRIKSSRSNRVTPFMFEYKLVQMAKTTKRHIVLPEGHEERVLRATEILLLRGICDITLLGDPESVNEKIKALGLTIKQVTIIDPLTSPLRESFADEYFELRKHKGISREMAFDTMADVSYFGTMLVHTNQVSGMVSGSVHTTQHTIRPAFEIIRTKPDTKIVSSVFFMCLEDRVLVYGDCAVNPDPDAQQLADIAINSAITAATFGVEPRVAMLSYSTGESGKGAAVDKVREATTIAKQLRPDLKIAGPMQYDAAIDAQVAQTKLPDSDVAGCATVFIFPDLNTGNNTYKAVQRSADAVAIGPILQGLNKPVNDLSRGCSVTDIVNTVIITAIQAQ
ncbi:MAG: phosphate acetyltransferase [Thiohalomonadales bacterium]